MVCVDPVELAQALIRRPSVTPDDAGAMDVVERALAGLGFACRRMRFGGVENLYARLGAEGPNLCFGGHTDVVPAGDVEAWSADPFSGQVVDGVLHGRGAVDMKGGVAAFIAAVSTVIQDGPPAGSLSLIVTGDEEGSSHDGAKGVVAALLAQGLSPRDVADALAELKAVRVSQARLDALTIGADQTLELDGALLALADAIAARYFLQGPHLARQEKAEGLA